MSQARTDRRYAKYYSRIMSGRRSYWDDWRFIWASRTHFGQKRSWVQRLIGW